MKGTVASYVAAKKFGFINGEDNQSYFFHVSALKHKADEERLIVGAHLDFDPTPTPKGLSAKQITVHCTYLKKKLVPFFTTKSELPSAGTVEVKKFIHTPFIKDLNALKKKFKDLAYESGCNAILSCQIEAKTFSQGNYDYTLHACQGYFAIVTEQSVCRTEIESNESNFEIEQVIDNFEDVFVSIYDRENKIREDQLKVKAVKAEESLGCLYTIIIGLIIFIFAAIVP